MVDIIWDVQTLDHIIDKVRASAREMEDLMDSLRTTASQMTEGLPDVSAKHPQQIISDTEKVISKISGVNERLSNLAGVLAITKGKFVETEKYICGTAKVDVQDEGSASWYNQHGLGYVPHITPPILPLWEPLEILIPDWLEDLLRQYI